MNRPGAVDPLEAIVGALVDPQEAARRAAARIVVDREDLAIGTHHDSERIPEALGDAAELGTVGLTGEDAAFSATVEFGPVGTGEYPILAEVLAEREDQVTRRCPSQAR